MLLLLLAASQAQPHPAQCGDWPGEVVTTAEAPYGYMHDSAGEWIALERTCVETLDFFIRAGDFRARSGTERVAWITVNHARNPSVSYRVSRTRISVNCPAQTIQEMFIVNYNADGSQHSSTPYPTRRDPIIPGSMGEAIFEKMCL
jgi:hypothetical protein